MKKKILALFLLILMVWTVPGMVLANEEGLDVTIENEETTGSLQNIKVSFRLIGASPSSQDVDLANGKEGYYGSVYQEWIPKKNYSIEEGASVLDLLLMVLDKKNLDYDLTYTEYGGYVSMIESPRRFGKNELAEFSNGQYSGWMFTVNGESPWTGIDSTFLSAGDKVLVYYTNDFRYEMEGYAQWYDISDYDGEFINAWLKVKKSSSSRKASSDTSSEAQEEASEQEEVTTKTPSSKQEVSIDLQALRNSIMEKPSILSLWLGSFLQENQNTVMQDVAKTVCQNVPNPTTGSIGGEWAVIGVKNAEIEDSETYTEKYYENLCEEVTQKEGILSDRKYTEYARVSLALAYIDKDASNVAGYNLIENLNNVEKVTFQGLNGAIYALMALDQNGYPSEAREKYITLILASQNEDGGFALAQGAASDVDMTAMAMKALAPYKENPYVEGTLNKALMYLSSQQNENGGFSSFGSFNLESTAQVLEALSRLGISEYDSRFVKNNNTIYDAMMAFYIPSQGFRHLLEDETSNQMATEQALLTLTSITERTKVH